MKFRSLTINDLVLYRDDIKICYKDNPQVFDMQSTIDPKNFQDTEDTLVYFVQSDDCCIDGIFDDEEDYLFGIIVYEDIRLTDNGNASQVHICVSKDIWGKDFLPIFKRALDESIFDVTYAIIPSCCRGAITLCKKLGFKKTGYIPKVIPYKTLKGETKMFDKFIYCYEKENILTNVSKIS